MRSAVKEACLAVLLVLALSGIAAVAFGFAWGLLDWMRNFGTDAALFPYLGSTAGREQMFHLFSSGPLVHLEGMIYWYNATFQGATRFGSGVGLIAGSIVALSLARKYGFLPRMVAAVVAGILLGGRMALMVTSEPDAVAWGMLAGVVAVSLLSCLLASSRRLPLLPLSARLPDF